MRIQLGRPTQQSSVGIQSRYWDVDYREPKTRGRNGWLGMVVVCAGNAADARRMATRRLRRRGYVIARS